jgi:hypothetical protein
VTTVEVAIWAACGGFVLGAAPCLYLLSKLSKMLDRAFEHTTHAQGIARDTLALDKELLGIFNAEDDDADEERVWS